MGENLPLTVVVNRVIKPGCEAAFERTMREFFAAVENAPGHLGMHLLRPAEGDASGEYVIIVRFASLAARREFTESAIYAENMARMDALSAGVPVIRELHGLDGWAALSGAPGNPPRWKMAVTVWVGVVTLTEIFSPLLAPLIGGWPRSLQIPVVAVLTVSALTWIVLPWAVRVLRGWYFPKDRSPD